MRETASTNDGNDGNDRELTHVEQRWFQLGASVVAMIMIANLQYAWTFFVPPLQTGTGWKLSDIQFAFTLFILFQTWVQPLDGWLIDRLGPRGFMSAAGLLCGLGWAGLGYATSLPMLYVLYCAAGMGAAFVYSASIGSALKWFKDRRGLAAGIMAAGFGGGTGAVRSHHLPADRGARLPVDLRRDGHHSRTRHPDRRAVHAASARGDGRRLKLTSAASTQVGKRQFTTPEMLRVPQFYVLYVMFVLMATGGLLVTANAGPMAKSWGFSASVLTLAGSLSPLANAVSRIFWGMVSDRIGREPTMVIAFVLQAICLFLVVAFGRLSANWFVFTLVLVYFTWGEIYSLFPSTSGDYFGVRHGTSNYAVLYTAKGVASIIGGWVGAKLFEHFGSWSVGFYGSAAMALVACAMAVGLVISRAKSRAAAAAPVPRRNERARARRRDRSRVRATAADCRAALRARSRADAGSGVCRRGGARAPEARSRPRHGGPQGRICQQGAVARDGAQHRRLGEHVRRHRSSRRDERHVALDRADVLAEDRAGDRDEAEGAAWRRRRGTGRRGQGRRARRARGRRVDRAGLRSDRLPLSRLEVSARGLRRGLRLSRRAHRRHADPHRWRE